MRAKGSPTARTWILRAILLSLVAIAIATLVWTRWIYVQIERYANEDQAAPADAIAVFGAAEYDGRPSPVYRARLDHAEALFHRGIAPVIITAGGDGGDEYSEGGVGREYLMASGVPEEAIIAETESRSTEESARRIAVIARANGFRRLVVVSDGSHLFRIHEICAADGLNVLTSPRPLVPVEGTSSPGTEPVIHEVLSYMLWRLDLH